MIVGILQPGYLPWLGFFEQMYKSDVFVVYDDVQYDKNGWRNRNKIKTEKGSQWLTVPVYIKFEKHPIISEVIIDNKQNWTKKHLLSIKHNYAKSRFYKEYISIFEEGYSKKWERLIDVDMYFILKIAESLGMRDKRIVRSSTLNIDGDKIGRLIKICKFFKADTFYEGKAGENYIDKDKFFKERINIEYQDYKHPVYEQLHGGFLPFLSAIDLIFNYGKESLNILTNTKLGGGGK